MDKIGKFVRKLDAREAQWVLEAIVSIRAEELKGLDVKKLRGASATYRVRVGKVRIIFINTGAQNIITGIEFRNENTY